MYVLPLSLSQLLCFGFALLFAFVFVITFAFAIYGVAFLLCVRGLYLLIPRYFVMIFIGRNAHG